MPRYILKLRDEKFNKDYYLEWSTVVDAPVTSGMSLEEFTEYYKIKYGLDGLKDLPERMARVEAKGTSSQIDSSAEAIIWGNRAGENENELSMEEIIEGYCRKVDA